MTANGVVRTGQRDVGSRGFPSGTPQWISDLQSWVSGTISVPGMPNYESARAGAVPLRPARPAAVAFCATEQDVRMSLLAAQDQGIPFRLRSGRHSATGDSSVDGGLVIDVRQLNNVAVDVARRTATVGAGANLGELDAALDVHMLHVPAGSSPTVGVAGFMQGGGQGWTSRQYGMNCDCVAAVRVMLADGRVVRATRDVNPSLLWAMCGGGGGNFGVLLDVAYDLADLYHVWGFELRWPVDAAPEILAAMQEGFARAGDAPDELGYKVVLGTIEGVPSLVMLGLFNGDRDAGMEVLAPLMAIDTCTMTLDVTDGYAAVSQLLLGGERLLGGETPTEGAGADTYVVHRSGFLTRTLSVDDWTAVAEWVKASPDDHGGAFISPYGGQSSRIAADDCAFVHRAVDMNVSVYATFNAQQADGSEAMTREWVDGLLGILEPFRDGSVYQNLPEEGLADYRTAYWGSNFPKLLAVKHLADPDDVFTQPQGVSPDPAAPTTVPELEHEPYMTYRQRVRTTPLDTRTGAVGATAPGDAIPRDSSEEYARRFDRSITLQAEAEWRADLDVLVRSPEWLTATTALDLGAGNGAWGRRVAARFPLKSIVALEPDANLHAIGAQAPAPPNYLYLNGGFEPGLEGFFDVLLARGVLLHLSDRRLLAQWASEHCAAVLTMNYASDALSLRPKLPSVTKLLSSTEWTNPADGTVMQRDPEPFDIPGMFAAAGFTLTGSTSAITELSGARGRLLAHHVLRAYAELVDPSSITDDLLDDLFDWSNRDDACLTMGATWHRFCNIRPWPVLGAS